MPKNLRFWTNVGLIAFAHILVIVGLIRWSRESKNPSPQSVVWLNGGGGDGLVTERKNLPAPLKSPLPRKESKTDLLKEPEPDEDRPYLASAPSDIQLPTPRPSPKPTPTATPARSPKPSPTAKAKTTSKPTPKPTSTASPARTPKKIVMAKASPKPSPAAKPSPEKKESEEGDTEAEKKEIAKALPAKDDSSANEPKKSPATQTGSGKGTAPGNGSGRAGGIKKLRAGETSNRKRRPGFEFRDRSTVGKQRSRRISQSARESGQPRRAVARRTRKRGSLRREDQLRVKLGIVL